MADAARGARRTRASLALTCGAVNFLYALYIGAISALLPAIGATFQLGPAAQGRLFPANFAGLITSVLLCGWLSDRWGRRKVLLLGTAVYVAALLLFRSAPTFGLALLAAPFIGAGSGAMQTVASALASELYPTRRAIVLNATQVAFGAGAILGPALANRVLALNGDWRAFYLILIAGNLGLFLALLAQPFPPSLSSLASGGGGMDWTALRALLRDPAFGTLFMMQVLYGGAEVGLFSWMPTYFRQLPGGLAWSVVIVSVFWVGMTTGRAAMGLLLNRVPLLTLGATLAGLGALFSAGALVTLNPRVIAACVALTGLCFGGIYSVILAETGQRFQRAVGTAFGGIAAAGGVGSALTPWLIGALAPTALHWRGALTLVPLSALLFTGLALWLRQAGRAIS